MDHVILNHGQVTWMTPELAPLSPNYHTNGENVSTLNRFNVRRCPTRRGFSGTGLELVTRQATIRYLYHSATAAKLTRKRRALRASESDEQRALRLENLRVHVTETRSSDQREVRLETDRIRTNQIRSSETTELRERRLQNVRISTARSRRTLHADLNLSAFHYDSNNDYSLHRNVVIGKMDKICMYCSALKFKNETRGMCCANGKVKLPELHSPPEPLSTFLSGVTRVSKHFLENIRKYNLCFQMTSFGATNILRENYMLTFRVQGQIYHYAGSLLPLPDADHKFLQIYLMANSDEQIENDVIIMRALDEKLWVRYKAFSINTIN
ncbi:uncharacterized protein TNCV_1726221 [Trichonephila clavipes]|nr:uncharacterized protein TNCV_1726221 [Trichonephila clavipes]